MVKSFNFFSDTYIEFGEGSSKMLPDFINKYSVNKIAVITDSVLIGLDFCNRIIENLNGKVEFVVFSQVEPNPTVSSVNRCAEFCIENGCDGVVAIGGGSVIDTAKAASVVASNGGSVFDYLDGRGIDKKEISINPLKIFVIPTTSGTGSEASQYAVITDERTKIKDSISSSLINPRVAIVDPELIYLSPKFVTMCTGLDVLSHAIESVTSKINNPLTDILALEAIKKVFAYLPECLNENTKESRNEMAFASLIAGIAMSHCCGTLPHGMGCPLSGHVGVPHGLAVGVLQIPTILNNMGCEEEEIKKIVNHLNPNFYAEDNEFYVKYLVSEIEDLFEKLNLETNLKQYKITEEQIDAMSDDAIIHGCTGLNRANITKEQIMKIYRSLV